MGRRVIAPRYGDLADVVIERVDDPEPGEGRVAIAVRAAGVNPADAKSILGAFGRDVARLPVRPGSEVAGVVEAVGAGVTRVAVGDEVLAFRVVGGFADRVVALERNVFAKPASLGFDEAAGLLLTGTTAWHLLEATGVGTGDRVLVHGASGAVGSAAVQLAVLRGASVAGTASAANADRVRELGAEWVAYGPGLVDRVREIWAHGPTAALDTVGTDEAVDSSIELVADPSRVATIAGFERGSAVGIRLLGAGVGADPGEEIRTAARPELVRLAGEGRVRVRVGARLPLERAGEALELTSSGHSDGKVVLEP